MFAEVRALLAQVDPERGSDESRAAAARLAQILRREPDLAPALERSVQRVPTQVAF